MDVARQAREWSEGVRALASALAGPGRLGVFAAAGGLALALATAALFRAFAAPPDPERVWFVYEFHDKRWLVLGYGLGVAALTCAPLLALRRGAFWSRSSEGRDAAPREIALRMGVALALYALWLGPPWNVAGLARPMEWHELVHLGPIQALLRGRDFYLESGTQYGPGMQMLSVHYLERFGVSLASFREFWLWANFAGGALLVAWLARLFPLPAVLLGLFALRHFSPFGFFEARPEGGYGFFYGWATTVRYAGTVHAVLSLGAVLARPSSGASDATLTSGERSFLVAAGAVFGWLALCAQENLSGGVIGCGLLGAFAWLTRAAPPRRLVAIALAFGAGALLGAAPILSLFAAAGELGAFAGRYFEVGGYVASGFSNVPFSEPWLSPAGVLFAGVPAAALLLFAVAAFDGARDRPWRVMAAAVAAAALAGHTPALLRSDASHILAMVTPVAFVFAAAATGLLRGGLRPASASALVLALLPLLLATRPEHVARLGSDAAGRAAAFSAPAATPVAGRVGFRYDLSAPYAVFSELPLGEFLEITGRLRELVGERPVVVSSAVGSTGHWYFFADLLPVSPDPEPMMTIHNDRLRARYLAELDARGIPCVISMRPEDAEVVLFRRQPGPRDEWILPTSVGPLFVGCRRETGRSESASQRSGSPARSPS